MRDTTAAAKTLVEADDAWLREVALRDPGMIRDVAAALVHSRPAQGPGCGATDCVNAYIFNPSQPSVAKKGLKGLWSSSPIFANDMSALSWQ